MIELDEIGTLYAAQAVTPAGQRPPEPQALSGWHVNATGPVPGWDAWRTQPGTPRRVFAGVQTVHYTFSTRAQYRTELARAELNREPPPAVPQAITMRQARLMLLSLGKLAAAEAAIAKLPEPDQSVARIEWEFSNDVHRRRHLVTSLAPALGMTEVQLDAFFIAAKKL